MYWALDRGLRAEALTFDYHGRPHRESAAVDAVARRANVGPVHRVPLPWLREASDLPRDVVRNPELERAPEGYVPARNLVFYAIGAHHAEILGVKALVGGHHGADAERFPDASPRFFDAFATAANLAFATRAPKPLEVLLPLRDFDKRQVLDLGFRLGVPFEDTWSCYWADRPRPCGTCAPCAERAGAFAAAGRADPLLA